MTIQFSYEKGKVIQALRYHFITRKEIRIMIILVNVFALASLLLYMFNKINAVAFLVGSLLWIVLMISFWMILPGMVYRRAQTFQHSFSMDFEATQFILRHDAGSRAFAWDSVSNFLESPHFFHIYFDNKSFILIPKTGFPTDDDIHAFRKMLKERIG